MHVIIRKLIFKPDMTFISYYSNRIWFSSPVNRLTIINGLLIALGQNYFLELWCTTKIPRINHKISEYSLTNKMSMQFKSLRMLICSKVRSKSEALFHKQFESEWFGSYLWLCVIWRSLNIFLCSKNAIVLLLNSRNAMIKFFTDNY